MSKTRMSVMVDEELMQKVRAIIKESDFNLSTAIKIYLKYIVQVGEVPIHLLRKETELEKKFLDEAYEKYIEAELDKSIAEANDPNTRWYTHEEMLAMLDERLQNRKIKRKSSQLHTSDES